MIIRFFKTLQHLITNINKKNSNMTCLNELLLRHVRAVSQAGASPPFRSRAARAVAPAELLPILTGM